MPKIYSRYDVPVDSGFRSDEPSLTQQQFKDESDINKIIDRYNRTGFLVDPTTQVSRSPIFDDFSSPVDFQQSQTLIAHAQQSFDLLPAYLRKRFNNSPVELLAFLNEEVNRDEAIKLGLISKPIIDTASAASGNPVPAVPAGTTSTTAGQ